MGIKNAGAQNSGMEPTEKTADVLGQRPFGFSFVFSFLSQAEIRRQEVGVERVSARRGTSPDRSASDGNSRTYRSSPAVGLAERTHVAMPRAEVRHIPDLGYGALSEKLNYPRNREESQ